VLGGRRLAGSSLWATNRSEKDATACGGERGKWRQGKRRDGRSERECIEAIPMRRSGGAWPKLRGGKGVSGGGGFTQSSHSYTNYERQSA
jgi:hypothetical protein